MKIKPRDIEVMVWILEQKFMTVEQVKKVFWKDTVAGIKNTYRRLWKLQKGGYLRRSRRNIYRNVLYLITAFGLRQLRAFGRYQGLSENLDVDYRSYKHDAAVTNIRIMFHKWGYSDWASERVIAMHHNDLRRVPDGMIYHGGRRYAVEYESTQKSKERYDEIFLEYELERQIDKVIYVVDTPTLLSKLCEKASACKKIRFVRLQHLQEQGLNSLLTSTKSQGSLSDLLERSV